MSKAEAAIAETAVAEARWQQHMAELFALDPNAPPASAGGFVFVAFVTGITAKIIEGSARWGGSFRKGIRN